MGFLDSSASCRHIVFYYDGGSGGGGGVSLSAVFPLGCSSVPEKVPSGICSLSCWLVSVLYLNTCSTLLWRLESCGLSAQLYATCATGATIVATANSPASCS